MNYIEQIFSRCDIQQISNFLLYGAEGYIDKRTFKERLDISQNIMIDRLKPEFSDDELFNDIRSEIYRYGGVIENVYTEIGLQLGFTLAVQLLENKGH